MAQAGRGEMKSGFIVRDCLSWIILCLSVLSHAPSTQAATLGDANASLWTLDTPLPQRLFNPIRPCAWSSQQWPTDWSYAEEKFGYDSFVAANELFIGLCLLSANLPEEANAAFGKAKIGYLAAIENLNDAKLRKAAELQDRKGLVEGLGKVLNQLQYGSLMDDRQRANFRSASIFYQIATAPEIESLNANLKAVEKSRPLKVGSTIRIPTFPTSGYLKHVVRVRTGTGHCTGTFVGPKIVLTNLHCVAPGMWLERDSIVAKEKFTVATWWTFRGERGVLTPQEKASKTCTPSYCTQDWALIEINESRADASDYLLVLPSTPRSDTVMVAGYSGDVTGGYYLTLDIGCPAQRLTFMLTFECSTAPGSSGSAVLSVYDQRYVMALNNSMQSREDSANSRGGTFAVFTEHFYPRLQELLGANRDSRVPGENARERLVFVKPMYDAQRQSRIKLPDWKD